MCDVVVSGETDDEEIRRVIGTELLAGDRGERGLEHKLVAERHREHRACGTRGHLRIVRERRTEARLADLPGLRVGDPRELREPRGIERRPRLQARRDRRELGVGAALLSYTPRLAS
jgi:hypothetical protein